MIVCGHYGCGGVKASLEGSRHGLIDNWLRHVMDVSEKHAAELAAIPEEQRLDRLCELNVIEQAMNVCQTTVVEDVWAPRPGADRARRDLRPPRRAPARPRGQRVRARPDRADVDAAGHGRAVPRGAASPGPGPADTLPPVARPSAAPSARTRVKRVHERAVYDRATIDEILDAALICHLGFERDGQPYVIPTLHARIGDLLYVHGSAASRTLRALGEGIPACVTVTLVDGIVLARSVFEHSMNYRSVVVLGTATPVVDPDEKYAVSRRSPRSCCPGAGQTRGRRPARS